MSALRWLIAVALGEVAGAACAFGLHQRIVVGKKGAPLGGAAGKPQKYVGDEAGLFLHCQHFGLDVFRQGIEIGNGVACAHGVLLGFMGAMNDTCADLMPSA